jgi:glycosyltransferase involved in cell wall biosynthesis
MKILHVLSDIDIESGGVAAAACGMAEAVAARGHDVAIACLNHGGTPLQPRGVTVRSFALDRNSSLLPSARLREYLQENIGQFAVVHIHGVWQHPGHYAAAAARKCRIPYILAPHGMLDAGSLSMGRRWAKSMAWFLWDSVMVNRAAAIQCLNSAEIRCSPALANTTNAIIGNGIPVHAMANLPPRGLWRQQMKANLGYTRRPIALFLSRIHPKKGLERLLPLWPEILKQRPELLLVIAGTGEVAHVDQVKEVAKRHKLEDAVFFAGQLSGATKWQALTDADIFLLPSYQEGFSMAITEAMAAGLPVVITRECNFDEVEQVHAGVVIDNGDMAAFVRAVAHLVDDAADRQRMGHNGRLLVQQRFTMETAAQKLEMLYQAVAQNTEIPESIMPASIRPEKAPVAAARFVPRQ